MKYLLPHIGICTEFCNVTLIPTLKENMSSCYRIYTFVMWMCNKNMIGTWNNLEKEKAIIPLDRAMLRMCVNLKVADESMKTPNLNTAITISERISKRKIIYRDLPRISGTIWALLMFKSKNYIGYCKKTPNQNNIKTDNRCKAKHPMLWWVRPALKEEL